MSHITDGDIHAYLDRALDAYAPAEAERIRAHLESCADCTQRLHAERRLRERATGILGGADAGALPLASLEELEARAAATGGPTDHTGKSRFSWRSPAAIGMGWAATIALALWTGYSVKDFAPDPAGRPSVMLEPARALDAVSADDRLAVSAEGQSAELKANAAQFRASGVGGEALRQLSSGAGVLGSDTGARAPADAVAEAERDQDAALDVERQRRSMANAELTERLDEAQRQESAPVDRSPAPASKMFRDARANEARGVSGTVTGEGPRNRDLGATTGKITIEDIPVESVTTLADVLSGRTEGLVLDGLDSDKVGDLRDSIATRRKSRIATTQSFSLSIEPLVFIDGVRLEAGLTAADSSRLADLDPGDIVSIDVLKAPEATELYGQDAAGGALLVITKRGFTPAPDLEVQRTDHVELPGMGQTTLIVQTLPKGGDLELWSVSTSQLATASPATAPEDRIVQITAYFENSLPRGWSMTVQARPGGYLVARAPLPQAELDALLARIPDRD